MIQPFAGLRVIDTPHVLAGPFASYQMALPRVEVIKAEHPDDPDQARFQGSDRSLVRRDLGAAFPPLSAGKMALALDLTTEAGHDALNRVVATTDISLKTTAPARSRRWPWLR